MVIVFRNNFLKHLRYIALISLLDGHIISVDNSFNINLIHVICDISPMHQTTFVASLRSPTFLFKRNFSLWIHTLQYAKVLDRY